LEPASPFSHDGTERRIERPQDSTEQTRCYRGKKKCHTVKNVLLINAALMILFLRDTYAGSTHHKWIAEATPDTLPAGIRLLQDLGVLAFTFLQIEVIMPTKKPQGRAHTHTQKAATEHGPPVRARHARPQPRQALSHGERPNPPVEGGRPRSGDGTLLCPAQLPGAPHALAADDVIEINSTDVPKMQTLIPLKSQKSEVSFTVPMRPCTPGTGDRSFWNVDR